mgnify:FL=1
MILSELDKLPHIIYVALPLAILVGTILYIRIKGTKRSERLIKIFYPIFLKIQPFFWLRSITGLIQHSILIG